jgi:hypothetical protein
MKRKSKRERAVEEAGKMLQEDPIFRENFLNALNPHVSPLIRAVLAAVLELSIRKQELANTDSKASLDSTKGYRPDVPTCEGLYRAIMRCTTVQEVEAAFTADRLVCSFPENARSDPFLGGFCRDCPFRHVISSRALYELSIRKQGLASTDSKASPDSTKGDSSAK